MLTVLPLQSNINPSLLQATVPLSLFHPFHCRHSTYVSGMTHVESPTVCTTSGVQHNRHSATLPLVLTPLSPSPSYLQPELTNAHRISTIPAPYRLFLYSFACLVKLNRLTHMTHSQHSHRLHPSLPSQPVTS